MFSPQGVAENQFRKDLPKQLERKDMRKEKHKER